MNTLLPSWPLLSAFLLASFILAITPGPGVLFIVARSATQGRRVGMASVLGVAAGNLGCAAIASVGLAALFAVSALAFNLVKIAGAGYLIYMGIRALRRQPPAESIPSRPAQPLALVFRDGFIVSILNPKTAIFFAAFLPQFLGSQSVTAVHSMTLGALFVLIATCTDTLYALAAGALASRLGSNLRVRRWGSTLSGIAFIMLGIWAALTGQRATPQ